jgi:hypothetical protein
MKEDTSINASAAPDEADVISLLKKMQQQLLFLERKIDLLIGSSRARSSGDAFKDRPFRKSPSMKPFRSFDQPQRHGKGEPARGPREKNSVQGHFYEHRPREANRGAESGKRPVSFKRKDRE